MEQWRGDEGWTKYSILRSRSCTRCDSKSAIPGSDRSGKGVSLGKLNCTVLLSESARRKGESKHPAPAVKEHRYYVYMIVSSSRRALYIGVTNNLERRVQEHRTGELGGFSRQYRTQRLVWFERYGDIRGAIDREKQIKGWRRGKKIRLIEAINPEWRDLSIDWGKPISLDWQAQGPSTRGSSFQSPLAEDDIGVSCGGSAG